jgi:CubicO group peptidase (beta-lactamase class C family)
LTVLDSWIAATVSHRELPGLSIGIVYDQDLIWAKGYGYAVLERRIPATPATKYRIASITKPFTATATMQLRDAAKLRLDDSIDERLPWFSVRGTREAGAPLTIRQLLTHTSGLPREVSGFNWNDLTMRENI